MKLKAVMALLGLVLILTGCTRVNANIIEDTKQDEEETKMTEISGEIGVDGIQKTIKMPIPEDLSEFLYFESLPADFERAEQLLAEQPVELLAQEDLKNMSADVA